ncbi:unnamed protein product [Protopolystoma xenopodis]|uniref:Uncharacterized protein n=1 Tax=Protopolystoma xenopodis TaxID=117903 RepID=A0A3S5AZM9_9PLAT|nr:unnamed protein product [Protopolystoma xenopodis]
MFGFIDPRTVRKLKLLKKSSKLRAFFDEIFDPELGSWLLDEIQLNKQIVEHEGQLRFWEPSPSDQVSNITSHDPRGCPTYVENYVEIFKKEPLKPGLLDVHLPHPNVLDFVTGKLQNSVGLTIKDRNMSQSEEPDPEEMARYGLSHDPTINDMDESDDDAGGMSSQVATQKSAIKQERSAKSFKGFFDKFKK